MADWAKYRLFPATSRSSRSAVSTKPAKGDHKGLRDAYYELHGMEPKSIVKQSLPPAPNKLVDLGPVTRVCYRKRLFEGGKEVHPEYCHRYGEKWPSDKLLEMSDVAAATERGDLYIIPRGNTAVTARGIEDKPMKTHEATRANPARAHRRPSRKLGFFGKSRRNPTVLAPTLSMQRVRVPSQTGIAIKNIVKGAPAAIAPAVFDYVFLQGTRLGPVDRMLLILGPSLLISALTMGKVPALAGGLALGAAAVATRPAIDAMRLLTMRR